ncbi:3913_t:CDS:2 [Cetraspora pellucida]|uniref:3913_t:CDS:1 n=1 Tax=Cetraspora pellucida TaxID=1433469 RepID=A0ACA9K2V3_9GLOM|nr:3913_t:CDS:2 [Cetraspora pellucida]
MTSDLKLLEQRIIDLEAENAELKAENAELKAENAEIPELRKKFAEVEDKNAKLETENFEVKVEIIKLRAELKSGIEELEKSRMDTVAESARRDIESDKLKARVAKLEQDSRQPQNDSPFEEAFSVPESVAVQLKKHMPFGENVEPEVLPEVAVTASPSLCEEDRKTDEFLDLVQKRSVSDGIRYRKRKEKLQHETAENPKDQEAPMISQNISSVKNVPILDDQQKITYLEEEKSYCRNELIQQLSTTINNDEVSSIFQAIRSGQNAILCWYHFAEKYDKRIDEVSVDKKVGKKKAMGIVYNEVKQLLPEITDVNLRQKLLRARKIRTLFSAIGVEKIRLVSYSANAISNLSYTQIQNIIDHVTKICVNKIHGSENYVTSRIESTESSSQAYIPSGLKAISDKKMNILDTSQARVLYASQSKPTYDRSYFRNKTLDQYPNLYQEGSDGNDDYYGITDESLCLLCKLDHDDENGIKGKYKIGSYNLKCEQCEIEVKWEAKLTELPSPLTDNIYSRLYKRYKKKTGLNPWINFETSEFFQVKDNKNKTEVCILPINKNASLNSCLLISILSDNSEEKQNLVIYTTLKQFNNLSLKHRNKYGNYYDYSEICPACNKEHKGDDVEGQ